MGLRLAGRLAEGLGAGRPSGVFRGGKWGMADANSSMQASLAFSWRACTHRVSSLIPYCLSYVCERERERENYDLNEHQIVQTCTFL